MIRDGAKVSYIGTETRGRAIGDEAKVLSGEPGYAHVQWLTGTHAGKVEVVRESNLVPVTATDVVFDGPVIAINVIATFQNRGGLGLINALNEEGHLMAIPNIAEEAFAFVASRLREDPSLKEALAQLDPEDADDVLAVACSVVLQEAMTSDS